MPNVHMGLFARIEHTYESLAKRIGDPRLASHIIGELTHAELSSCMPEWSYCPGSAPEGVLFYHARDNLSILVRVNEENGDRHIVGAVRNMFSET